MLSRELCIWSGGQTGVDRAALDAAIEVGLRIEGWCPKGRLAEDGPIPPSYALRETDSDDYAVRTEWNVRDTDGTLVLSLGDPEGGTAYTIAMAKKWSRPFLVVDLEQHPGLDDAVAWLADNAIGNLNVAGPRGSKSPDVYPMAKDFVRALLDRIA